MRNVLIAGLMVAIVLAPLSVYVVLRRIVFVGAAVAEISSSGVALAVLFQWEPFPVALVLSVGALLGFAWAEDSPHLPPEALVGITYAAGSAAAVLLIVKAPRGEGSILNVLFGNILTVPSPMLWAMGGAFFAIMAIEYMASKEFLIVAYDPDMARAMGIRAGLWNALFYTILGVAIAVSIRAVGALLSFALLVAPGAAALSIARKLKGAFIAAVLIGVSSTLGGIVVSYRADLPTGPTIVAALALAFALSYVYAQAHEARVST